MRIHVQRRGDNADDAVFDSAGEIIAILERTQEGWPAWFRSGEYLDMGPLTESEARDDLND